MKASDIKLNVAAQNITLAIGCGPKPVLNSETRKPSRCGDWATGWMIRGSNWNKGDRFLSSPKSADRIWGPSCSTRRYLAESEETGV
jgi:hypothetical protein